jgi:hypothetical protein
MLPQHQAHGFLLRSHSLQTLRDFISSVTASTRFIRCFLNIKLMVFCPFSVGELLTFSTLLFILSRALHTHPSYPGPSVRRKTWVSLGLQDPVVLRADILQVDHASIHGVG